MLSLVASAGGNPLLDLQRQRPQHVSQHRVYCVSRQAVAVLREVHWLLAVSPTTGFTGESLIRKAVNTANP